MEFSGFVAFSAAAAAAAGVVVIVISVARCVVNIGCSAVSTSAALSDDFRLDDGESIVVAVAVESLSLLFITETVDGVAVVTTLLVVSLATAVAISDADAVSLMTICCTTPVFGLSSTSIVLELLLTALLNSIKSTDFCCCVDDIFLFLSMLLLNVLIIMFLKLVGYQIQSN